MELFNTQILNDDKNIRYSLQCNVGHMYHRFAILHNLQDDIVTVILQLNGFWGLISPKVLDYY